MPMRQCATLLLALLASLPGLASVAEAQPRSIDTANSKLLIHVFKTGLFSGFADNHLVEAPISNGTVDESALRVTFAVDSRQMKVLDPQLQPDRRQQIQQRMLGAEVLDSVRFPQIIFQSTSVEPSAEGRLLVRGQLSLRGVTRPVSAIVTSASERYLGTCNLKQRDFGITPISIVAGTVKVKDELKIEFDIRTKAQTASQSK